ncbi:hypothetical protein TH53_12540 [Pedobacter lusitanus]|uniref:Uncharacterized protein n=1 Tax=Pedobacter lusitanus TaxID=1503925 RepID=A0A0D0FWQ8_9SPHI|nr:hypothetical protein [Pedobacter lusitanus]KIO76914.1 hypothetical protein TH53_12540 [Pedobacter lusitanus]
MGCLILFFAACKKDILNSKKYIGTNEINIQEAKDYFYNSVLKNADGKITSSDSKTTNSDEIPSSLWEYARKKGLGVRVPLKFDSKLKYKIEGTTRSYSFDELIYLFLYKNKEDKFEVEKVTTMPDKDYVNNTSKERKFSGLVIVEDWYGNIKKVFQYKGGQYRKLAIQSGPYANKTSENRTVVNGLGDGDCVYISGGFACVGAGGGQTCTERPGRYVCPGGGGIGPWGPENGGRPDPTIDRPDPNGTDEGYVEPPSTSTDISIDFKGYPCAQDLGNKLPQLKNSIEGMLISTFSQNQDVNLTFEPRPSLKGTATDGELVSAARTNYVVGINPDILENSTKEYILVTLYHEGLHAYFAQKKKDLGDDEFNKQFLGVDVNGGRLIAVQNEGHWPMGYDKYIRGLKDAILSFNPNFGEDRAIALAQGGIVQLNQSYSDINDQERDTRKTGYKGTKCP